MDKFTSDGLTVVFVAPVALGVGGLPRPACGGRNETALMCNLYGGSAVGSAPIGDIEVSGLTQPPPDAALSDGDRSWGANFSSMLPGRARCVVRQFTGANVSDTGMPA